MLSTLLRRNEVNFWRLARTNQASRFSQARSNHNRCAPGIPDVMRASHIRVVGSNGGPEALEVVHDFPVPQCGEHDVLIKVAAAGVNRPDVLQRKGVYPPPAGHSPLPGLEVSGQVVCLGASVPLDQVKLGDRVCALTNGGGYAEYAAVPFGQVLPVPKGLSLAEAACLPETMYTVYHVLFEQCNIFGEKLFDPETFEAGTRLTPSILIHGGTSGIGTTAIQLARAFGADPVVATAGSAEKCRAIENLGAHGINYKLEDFVQAALEVAPEEGFHMILDMVAGPYFQKNLSLLRPQGRLAIIGSQGSPISDGVDARFMMRNRLTVGGSTIRARSDSIKARIGNALKEFVWPLLESGQVKVVFDQESFMKFDLDTLSDAHRRMESSQHIGKIFAVVDRELLNSTA